MRHALVHVDDVRRFLADDAAQAANASHIELMPQRQALEGDARFFAAPPKNGIRPADDGDVVAARTQSRGSLEHLVHRAGVELVEFEDLKNAHWFPVSGSRLPV